jgi:hypothetical protein
MKHLFNFSGVRRREFLLAVGIAVGRRQLSSSSGCAMCGLTALS